MSVLGKKSILFEKECSQLLDSKELPLEVDKDIKEKLRLIKTVKNDCSGLTLEWFLKQKRWVDKICRMIRPVSHGAFLSKKIWTSKM